MPDVTPPHDTLVPHLFTVLGLTAAFTCVRYSRLARSGTGDGPDVGILLDAGRCLMLWWWYVAVIMQYTPDRPRAAPSPAC